MKKLIFLLALSVSFFQAESFGQVLKPRFSVNSSGDQTFANMKLNYNTAQDAVDVKDTLLITPSVFSGNINITVNDTCVLAFKNIGSSYIADHFTLVLKAGTGTGKYVTFTGYSGLTNKWAMSSTGINVAIPASKFAILEFYFNGEFWIEKSRVITN